MPDFTEVAAGVYVLRYPVLDVNTTLIVGHGAALLVDTLSTEAQAQELAEAVRRVTPHPWTVVNTHHHFDHTFGNAVFAKEPGCAIWGHEEAVALLRDHAEELRRGACEAFSDEAPGFADQLAAVTIVPPNRTTHLESTLDIGGRTVVLRHLGRGHTRGDLIVQVPDADLIVAGDLVEESGPPGFHDSYPLRWPEAVAALLRLTGPDTTVVPGHGAVVDRDFVARQHGDLTALAWLIREEDINGSPPEKVARHAPFGYEAALVAVRRGYAELTGRV